MSFRQPRKSISDASADTAIFNSLLSTKISENIPATAISLGLAPQYIGAFIGALTANDQAALAKIPGVTPEIIAAGVHTLQEAYLNSFKGVWIAAAVLSGVTLLGQGPHSRIWLLTDWNSFVLLHQPYSRPEQSRRCTVGGRLMRCCGPMGDCQTAYSLNQSICSSYS